MTKWRLCLGQLKEETNPVSGSISVGVGNLMPSRYCELGLGTKAAEAEVETAKAWGKNRKTGEKQFFPKAIEKRKRKKTIFSMP